MDLQRGEYPNMLTSLDPQAAMKVLDDRVKHINQTNTDIADWLEERRTIEHQYVASLHRLARRSLPNTNSELGIFTEAWNKIVSAAEVMGEAHQNLAMAIERDVERPLRDFNNKDRSLQAVTTTRGNLAAIAKDYLSAQKKVEKAKAGRASEEMESTQAQWESQAPYVFESLQAADERRCNHLRDVLTQFQTHEIDRLDRGRKASEAVINALLSCETANEITAFSVRRVGSANRTASRPERTTSRPERTSSIGLPAASSYGAQGGSSLSPPPTNGDDAVSQNSVSMADEKEEKKGRFKGGLKRLGTVMSRRKSSQPTPPPKSRNAKEIPATAQIPEEDEESEPARTGTLRSSNNLQRNPSSQVYEPPEGPPPTNGSHSRDLAQLQEPLQPQSSGAAAALSPSGASIERQPEAPSRSLDPIAQAQFEAANVSEANNAPYNFNIQSAPLATTNNADNEAAMATMASTLRAQAPAGSRRSGTVRGRRDGRNSYLPPSEDSQTFNVPANAGIAAGAAGGAALGASSAANLPSLPAGLGSAVSVGSPSSTAASPPQASPALQSQPFVSRSIADDSTDTQSIRSGHSMASSMAQSGIAKHSEVYSPGLNSSIVETVSAWQDHGSVTNAVVIGELAVAYNSQISTPREAIRLENFGQLDKVAPNPTFVSQSSAERPGEYQLELAPVVGSRPQVAFKYQVHLDIASMAKQAPLLLTPSWKVEPTQTSVILTYTLNPAFASSAITLHNVMLVLSLGDGSSRAASCQSKPAGNFSKERNAIYWRIDELSIAPGKAPEKVIARFSTPEGTGTIGKAEARWELTGVDASIGSGLTLSASDGGNSSDPFADEERATAASWRHVQGVRKLVSGTYQAQ